MALEPGFLGGDNEVPASTAVAPTLASKALPSAVSGGTEAAAAPLSGPMLLEADETAPVGRVSPVWEPALIAPISRRPGAMTWFAAGLMLLLGGWVMLSAAGFASDQFHRSAGLGVLTVAVFAAAAVMLGLGVCIELRAWRALHSVDDLRAALAATEKPLAHPKVLCHAWVRRVERRLADPAMAFRAVEMAATMVELRAALRDQVLAPLRHAAHQAGRRAALEGGALVAITPSDALDGVMAGLRGLALVRQVAQLYGVRPGMAVTLILLRRVAWTAAGVSGMELLSQTLADHALKELPIVKRLVGAVPGSGLAAIRLYRLAGMTAEACSPLPSRPGRAG